MTTENMVKTLRMLQKRFEGVNSNDTGGIKISYLGKDVADRLEMQQNTIRSLEDKLNKLIKDQKQDDKNTNIDMEAIDIINPEYISYTDIYIEPIVARITRCAYGSLSDKVDDKDYYIALYNILNALNKDKNKEVKVNLRQGAVNIKLSEPVEDKYMRKYSTIGIYRRIPMNDIGVCPGSEFIVRLNNPVRFYDNYKTGSVYSDNPSDNFRFGGITEIILYYSGINSNMVTDISFKYTSMSHSCIKHIEDKSDNVLYNKDIEEIRITSDIEEYENIAADIDKMMCRGDLKVDLTNKSINLLCSDTIKEDADIYIRNFTLSMDYDILSDALFDISIKTKKGKYICLNNVSISTVNHAMHYYISIKLVFSDFTVKERDTNESENIEFGSDNYELNFDSIINSLRKKCADTLLSGAAIDENYIKDTALLDILDKVLSDEYLVLELEPSYNNINLYPSKKIQDKSRVILPSKENGLPKFKVIYNDLDDDNKIKIQINDDTIHHFDVFNYIELCFDDKDRTMIEKIKLKVVDIKSKISNNLDDVYETTHYNDSLIFKLDKDSLVTGVNLSIVPESAFLTLFNVANTIGKLDYVEHDDSFIRLKCNDSKLNSTIALFIRNQVNFYVELGRKFDDGKVITYPFENCVIKELSTEGDIYISYGN